MAKDPAKCRLLDHTGQVCHRHQCPEGHVENQHVQWQHAFYQDFTDHTAGLYNEHLPPPPQSHAMRPRPGGAAALPTQLGAAAWDVWNPASGSLWQHCGEPDISWWRTHVVLP